MLIRIKYIVKIVILFAIIDETKIALMHIIMTLVIISVKLFTSFHVKTVIVCVIMIVT